MRVDLNGIWLMNSPHYHDLEAQVPGSVLSTLLAHNLIPDPFWGAKPRLVPASMKTIPLLEHSP